MPCIPFPIENPLPGRWRTLAHTFLAMVLAGVGWGCTAKTNTSTVPSGDCAVDIQATLVWAGDGGTLERNADDAANQAAALQVVQAQGLNLRFYLRSKVDFQYQVHLTQTFTGLVTRTLVPTTPLTLLAGDPGAYIWDVIPVDTAGLLGAYRVDVGAHIDVDPNRFRCSGPLNAAGDLNVSTWKSLGLDVQAPGMGTSSSGPPSSGAGASSGS